LNTALLLNSQLLNNVVFKLVLKKDKRRKALIFFVFSAA